jgi:chorismate-pyruvate lyase
VFSGNETIDTTEKSVFQKIFLLTSQILLLVARSLFKSKLLVMPNKMSYQLEAKTPFGTRISQHSGRLLRHQQGNARAIDTDGKGGD